MQQFKVSIVIIMVAMVGVACSSESAPDVRIEVSNPVPGFDSFGPFVASGGAVEDGVMCAVGEGSLMAVEDIIDGGVLADWEFVCDGNAGGFTLQVQVPAEIAADQTLWDEAVSGTMNMNAPWIILTGDSGYADVEGSGMYGWMAIEPGKGPDTGGGVLGVFEGEVTSTAG